MDTRSEMISFSQSAQVGMGRSLRYLMIVVALFVALLPAPLCLLEWAAWRLSATIPLSTIANEQQNDKGLLWLGGFKDYAPYKIERIKLVQPEVLLVGSSRCENAREQMFRPYRVYNACLTVWSLDQMADFIDRATSVARPRLVIVALDYFLFEDQQAAAWRVERTMDYRQGLASHRRKLHDVLEFAAGTNWTPDSVVAAATHDQIEAIDHNRLIGPDAIRARFGFRADGSLLVPPAYRALRTSRLAMGATFVTASFRGGTHLSERQFAQIERLSRLANERGFTVVAIQYPILKAATDFMDTSQSYWSYAGLWRELRSETTADRLADLGIRFFDMSRDPSNADSSNFVDPAHPSERGMLRTFISLLDQKHFQDLLPLIDKAALEDDLQKNLKSSELFDLYH